MAIDVNTEETTPSQAYPGASTPHFQPHPDPAHALEAPRRSRGIRVTAVVVLCLILLAIAFRLFQRSADKRDLTRASEAAAAPTVNVIRPSLSGGNSEIALPGNTQPYNDTPIYARTSGYLKQWFVDIGQRVHQGQLMATIETPELDEQLAVAQANLKSAQADLQLAVTTAARYQNLLKSDSVSKQETDVAVSTEAAREASVDAAAANVRRLQQLQSFEKVYAPFSGVVTARNTDIGALIDSGSPGASNSAKELFHIAAINKLRIFVPVPEVYAPDIHNGDIAALTLDEYPGQKFTGIVTRNSSAIDMASRTLNVEVDVDNSNGKLLPGAYVFVHFKVPVQERMLNIPSNALLFRKDGMQVALVRSGVVHLQSVTIGKDNGRSVQISTGLSPNDEIIIDPSDSIAEGQQVNVNRSGQVNQ
jgi:RND family efflux transporter MFP subunit